ncbi:hypothetical protein CRUP_003005, partial [Coryphaenoides rupestris]
MTILQIDSLMLALVWSSLSLRIWPDTAYPGSKVIFQCLAAEANSSLPVNYWLLMNEKPVDKMTQINRPAKFSTRIEGSYYCTVTSETITVKSNRITLRFIRTSITSEPNPAVLYEGSRLTLSCNATHGSQLSYTWFFNRSEVTPLTSPSFRPAGSKLVVDRVTPLHAGIYSCLTEARLKQENRSSSSKEVRVVVK